ncbi:MAG: AMP-binding protein [Bacteroidota bacterium]
MSNNVNSIPQLFKQTALAFPDNIALWEHLNGSYCGITYRDLNSAAIDFANGLYSMSIQSGDRIALLSEGKSQWVISELGLFMCGAACVPLSVKLEEGEDILFRLIHSGARMLLISTYQYPKIESIINRIPDYLQIVMIDGNSTVDNHISYNEIITQGRLFLKDHPETIESVTSMILPDDLATISYTSGTTADPKGIMLTHKNYISNIAHCSSLFYVPEWYVTLLLLPWDHSFAHTVGIYTVLSKGAAIACVQQGKTAIETLRNIPKNIKEIRPHFILSVPALAKNFRNNIVSGIEQRGKFATTLLNLALKTAYAYNGNGLNKGKGWRSILKPQLKLYDALLFKKIREAFGGRLAFFVGGAALLDIDLQNFFYAIGIPMYQGFGLTEAAPVISCNSPKNHKLGTSGKIAQGIECIICDESGNELPSEIIGEIVVKGDNVMKAYWNNPQTTAQTIKEGKLYTGDLGYFDRDGFLVISGRFKSLLISSDGEKFSPEAIEEHITEHSPIIHQIMLYNNQHPYTIALIVPNATKLKKLNLHHSSPTPEQVIEVIKNEMNQYKGDGVHQGKFPERWLPAAFIILEDEFSEKNHTINSTMKMVRPAIVKMYASEIEYLYTAEGKNVLNKINIASVEKLLNS